MSRKYPPHRNKYYGCLNASWYGVIAQVGKSEAKKMNKTKHRSNMKSNMVLMALGSVLFGIIISGCDSGGGSGDGGASATTLEEQNISIPMGATHQTGVLTAPGDGALSANIKSLVGSDLKGSFYRVWDGATLSETTGPDFTISTATTSGQTWRVKVFNPSGVPIDTQIKVDFVP